MLLLKKSTNSVSITPIDDNIINDPCTPTASCSQQNHSIGSEEKRREILAKKISPLTSGEGVPTLFKKKFLWPKSPIKTKSVTCKLNMPAVVHQINMKKKENLRNK